MIIDETAPPFDAVDGSSAGTVVVVGVVGSGCADRLAAIANAVAAKPVFRLPSSPGRRIVAHHDRERGMVTVMCDCRRRLDDRSSSTPHSHQIAMIWPFLMCHVVIVVQDSSRIDLSTLCSITRLRDVLDQRRIDEKKARLTNKQRRRLFSATARPFATTFVFEAHACCTSVAREHELCAALRRRLLKLLPPATAGRGSSSLFRVNDADNIVHLWGRRPGGGGTMSANVLRAGPLPLLVDRHSGGGGVDCGGSKSLVAFVNHCRLNLRQRKDSAALRPARAWLDSARTLLDDLCSLFSSSAPSPNAAMEAWCAEAFGESSRMYKRETSCSAGYYGLKPHQRGVLSALRVFWGRVGISLDGEARRTADRLVEWCTAYWTDGRQQCDAVSATGQPCMWRRNHAASRAHQSAETKNNFIVQAACACGRSQSPYRDAFDLETANCSARLNPCCRSLSALSVVSIPGVSPGDELLLTEVGDCLQRLPFPSWHMRRLGTGRCYRHSTGLLQDGFLPACNFLTPISFARDSARAGREGAPNIVTILEKSSPLDFGVSSPPPASLPDELGGFVGLEYECARGHRFFDDEMRHCDRPVFVPCRRCPVACLAQLQRLFVVTPQSADSPLSADVRVRIALPAETDGGTTVHRCSPGGVVELPCDSLLVLCLPRVYKCRRRRRMEEEDKDEEEAVVALQTVADGGIAASLEAPWLVLDD